MLGNNQSLKEFLIFGCFNKPENESELLIGRYEDNQLKLFKRILLNTKSFIRKILPLNDLYSFVVVTQDGVINLCDLSMRNPKEKIMTC